MKNYLNIVNDTWPDKLIDSLADQLTEPFLNEKWKYEDNIDYGLNLQTKFSSSWFNMPQIFSIELPSSIETEPVKNTNLLKLKRFEARFSSKNYPNGHDSFQNPQWNTDAKVTGDIMLMPFKKIQAADNDNNDRFFRQINSTVINHLTKMGYVSENAELISFWNRIKQRKIKITGFGSTDRINGNLEMDSDWQLLTLNVRNIETIEFMSKRDDFLGFVGYITFRLSNKKIVYMMDILQPDKVDPDNDILLNKFELQNIKNIIKALKNKNTEHTNNLALMLELAKMNSGIESIC